MSNFNGNGNGISTVQVLTDNVGIASTIVSENVTPVVSINSTSIPTVKQVRDLLLSLGLSPLPVAPKNEKFNGKCPSFLDKNGVARSVLHGKYKNELPSQTSLERWFANPDNGIGSLGSDNFVWIDIDLKNFDDGQHGCDTAFNQLLGKYPVLKNSWLEQTRSGGYRIGVKIKNKPEFTNFTLSENGKHIGECLGYGRFTVLSPTVGYKNLNYPLASEIPEIESLESIGIFKSGKSEIPLKPNGTPDTKQQNDFTDSDDSNNSIDSKKEVSFNDLVCSSVKLLLNNPDKSGDRSSDLTKVANETYGWVNFNNSNGNKTKLNESPESFIHDYGLKLDLDSARIDRILETVDKYNVLPAIHYRNGDSACFRKVERATSTREKYHVIKSVEETILIDSFNDGDSDICVINGAFFEYTGQGYWKLLNDEQVEQFIVSELRKLKSYKKLKDSIQIIETYATDKNKKNCLSFCRTALSKFNNESEQKLRCFKNVTVDFATGQILNHSKEHYLQSQIPHDYKENSDCPKVFRDFVESSYGLDLLDLIRASMATFIDPTAPYEKLIHLMGESGSGKGTLADLFVEMSGQDFTASLDKFHELGKKESLYQSVVGKSLIAFLDLDGYQQSATNLYKITRNEPVTGRALYAKTNTTFKANCRILVCSVNPVSIESSGLGWDGRAVVIPSKSAIKKGEIDPGLKGKLRKVLADIISWALSMSKTERDETMANHDENERVKLAKLEQTKSSSSVISFIDSVLNPSQYAQGVSSDELYQWYIAFAKCRNYKPAGYQKFIVDMKRTLPNNFIPGKSGRSGRVKDSWVGISNIAVVLDNMGGYTCDITRLLEGGYDMFLSPVVEPVQTSEQTEQIQPVQASEPVQIVEPVETVEQVIGTIQVKNVTQAIIDSNGSKTVDSFTCLSSVEKQAVLQLLQEHKNNENIVF